MSCLTVRHVFFAPFCIHVSLSCLFLAHAEDYLARGRESAYVILVEPEASPSERYAADELATYFMRCTGAALPVVSTQPEDGRPMLVIGGYDIAKTLGVDLKSKDLGEQGFIIRSVPPHLLIAGTPAAGTLYGVYHFLETVLGVRWYAPGVEKTPEISELPLPALDLEIRPAFTWRHTSYAWPGKDDAFLARMRDNAGGGDALHPFGVQHLHDGRCHSYFWYVSPEEFFEEHPEYFSEIGGARRSHETQLCLTHPDVLEIVTERMLRRMAERPQVRQHNFSQMDYYNYCECSRCNEINQRYGTAGGTQYWFLNRLAERTAREYPDKLIGTLAYMYTEEPPKGMEMHPNIAVWLCHMFPSCHSHAIVSCARNRDYKRRALELRIPANRITYSEGIGSPIPKDSDRLLRRIRPPS